MNLDTLSEISQTQKISLICEIFLKIKYIKTGLKKKPSGYQGRGEGQGQNREMQVRGHTVEDVKDHHL
jgi:hypothetical protein